MAAGAITSEPDDDDAHPVDKVVAVNDGAVAAPTFTVAVAAVPQTSFNRTV